MYNEVYTLLLVFKLNVRECKMLDFEQNVLDFKWNFCYLSIIREKCSAVLTMFVILSKMFDFLSKVLLTLKVKAKLIMI